ncbi:MAG: hypothetical protein J6W96_00390, partial [Alphaproteobacteria bacterium]|nr:hypothetical protein [Alphaproteobacteria bacterium]
SSGTNGNVSGPTDIINSIWSNGITYGSIFDEKANTSIDGHEMACGPNVTTGFDGIQCFVACSCASGWFDTKQDALAAVGTSANNSNLNFAPSGGASSGAPSVSVSSNIPVTTMSGTTTLITFSDAGDGVVQAQTNRQYAFGGQKSCFKRVGPTCPNEYFSLTAAEKAAQEAAGKVCTEDPSNPGCYKCEDKCYFIVSKVGTGIADPDNGTTKVKFKIKRVKQDGVTPAPATPIDSGTGLFGIEYVLYSYFDMALIGSWDNGVMHDAGIVPPSCGNDCPVGTEHAITGSSTHVTSNLLWYTDIIKVSDAVDETLSTYKWHSSTAGHPEECSTGAGRYTYMEDDETYEYMCYEWPGNRTRSYQYYINEDIFDDPMDFEATVTPIDSSGEITIEYYRAGDAGVMAAEPQEWTVATFNNKTACEIVVEHCPEGYIESIIEPNSDYFTYEVDYGVTNNTKCYKITGCKPGYSEVGSSACAGGTFFDYHCYKSPDDYPVYFNLNQNSSNTWQPMGKCEKPIGSNSLLPDDLKVERLTFIDELSQTFVKTYTDKKLLCTGDLRYLQDIGGGGPVTDTFGGNHSFKTDIETAILGVEGVSLTGDDYIPISHGDVFTHEGKCLRLLIDDQPTSCMDYPVYFRYSRSIEDGRTKFNVYMKCTVGGGPGNWSVKGITYRAPGAPSVSLLLNKIIPCTGEFNPMPIAEITPIGSPQSITIVNVDLLKPGASNSLDTISNGDDFYYDGNCLNLNERFEEDICPDGYFLTSPQLTTAEQEIFSIASTSGTDGRTCYALGCKSPYVGSKPYNKIYHTYTHSELGLTNVSCYKVGKEIPAELQLHIASSVHKDGSSCNYDYLYNEPSPDNRSRLEAGDTAWNLYEIQQDGVTITTNNDDSYGNIRISVSKIYPSGNSAWAVGPTVDCKKDQLENLCSYGGIVFYTHDCGSSEACSCPALTCEAKGAYNDRLDITYTWQDQGNGQTRSMTKLYNNIRCVIARFGNGNF